MAERPKRRRLAAGLAVGGVMLMLLAALFGWGGKTTTYAFAPVTGNPGVGFAPPANDPDAAAGESLVYLGVRWAAFEPSPGVYDFAALEETYHLARWRSEGKHAVLRFLCDVPGESAHRDIPDWLYRATKDGVDYTTPYGKGYAPDYNNPVFIAAHQKAIAALGQYCSRDTFVLYVELGSLGHWGEWHVYTRAGLPGIPAQAVAMQYVQPYLDNFSTAKLLARRPFAFAQANGLGVYNDMTGAPGDTAEWLAWLREGGVYDQPPQPEPLAAMGEVWNNAPVGGEFTSSIPMETMLGDGLSQTLALLGESHMSFLGPKCPHGQAAVQVRQALGYQIWVSKSVLRGDTVRLTWRNSGAAPLYWAWPVALYGYDADGALRQTTPVALDLTKLTPGAALTTTTRLPHDDAVTAITLGIVDPLTGEPAVKLAMEKFVISR